MAIIEKSILHSGDLKLSPLRRRKRTLKVSKAELNGIREIMENPEPPTPELKAAWEDYKAFVADNPDSNW